MHQEQIKLLLTNFKTLRDDDPALYLNLATTLGLETDNMHTLLTMLSYSSMVVLRQNIQRKYPELRGENYREKKKSKLKDTTFMSKINMWWSTI